MNAGWRTQYENDTIWKFAMLLRFMAAERPQDTELQAIARKAKLTAIMLFSQEKQAIEHGNVAKDRLSDCSRCRLENVGLRPCESEQGKERICRWETPEHKIWTIQRHFGAEGLKWLEEIGRYAEQKTEATTCR